MFNEAFTYSYFRKIGQNINKTKEAIFDNKFSWWQPMSLENWIFWQSAINNFQN